MSYLAWLAPAMVGGDDRDDLRVAAEGRGYGGDNSGRFAEGDQGFALA